MYLPLSVRIWLLLAPSMFLPLPLLPLLLPSQNVAATHWPSDTTRSHCNRFYHSFEQIFPAYSDPFAQLKSLLKARGLPLPPPEQILKENLVAILQASDADDSTTNDTSTTAPPAAVRSGSLCAAELEQLHLEIIEQAASLRAETIKNPVKAQALRRLTTCLADMGVSALSSHIPQSQLDIKR